MPILLTSAAFIAAAICAAIMGYAIQRGATCTVAAMDEVVRARSCKRIVSMLEASLWVASGLLIAQTLQVLGRMPAGYPLGAATLLGGALLGIGAYVNRACVFGAIARLGSGEWAYVLTPIGFYVGCLTVAVVLPIAAPAPLARESPVLHASPWIALPLVALVMWRLQRALRIPAADGGEQRALPRIVRGLAARVWSPHAATTVIGIAFVVMLVAVGAWAYTDALAELAHGMASNLVARTLLLGALFAGAMLGGYTAGRFASTRVSLVQLGRCFGGGVMMGWGSLLIPGSNDGLVLIGLPLLWPYAWVAFGTMCAVIAVALVVERAVAGRLVEPALH